MRKRFDDEPRLSSSESLTAISKSYLSIGLAVVISIGLLLTFASTHLTDDSPAMSTLLIPE